MTNLFRKVAVCTDIHWGLKSNSLVHNRDCEAFIDWFIAKAKEEGCETGMFLGDWHNHRASMNLQTLQFSVQALEKLSKAYVINLDNRNDRWESTQKYFKDSFIDLERISAIRNENGHLGCGMSIQKVIKMAKDNNMKSILIMEDDCKPSDDFNKSWPLIKNWLDTNKDKWDIFIGGNTYYGSVFTSNTHKQLDTVKPICIINSSIKLYYTKLLCLHFYYLNRSGYDNFLEWKKDIDTNGAVDVWPNTIKMKIVSCIPFIATQESNYSNIGNNVADYDSSFKTSEHVIASIQNNSIC